MDEFNTLQGELSILLSNTKEIEEDPQRDDLGQFKKIRNQVPRSGITYRKMRRIRSRNR